MKPDTYGCVANTIKVVAGHYVGLANPQPESLDIRTIAGALSKMCRFGCHCPRFYSVAEHCVHATLLAIQDGLDLDGPEVVRSIFMHDAAEAYIGDVVKPLKLLLPDYAIVEHRMESAIEQRFGVDFSRFDAKIKHYDRTMLKAEKIVMWPEDTVNWSGFGGVPDRSVGFHFWGPTEAEIQFIAMAKSLLLDV